jgi:Holliday junction DNA helicase RuvA
MIHYLSGTILSLQENTLLVTTNNIGYEVLVPHHYTYLPEQKITLYIHPHLTTEQYLLFGFVSMSEKKWFKLLINISGIGPKTALNILSRGVEALHQAILKSDKVFFENISGIGKKTALKILIELTENPHLPQLEQPKAHQTATETLIHLGYDASVVQELLKDLPDDISSGQAVTLAIQKYAKTNQR